MARRDVVRNPVSTLENTHRRFSGAVGDDHDHFIASGTIQEGLLVLVVGGDCQAENSERRRENVSAGSPLKSDGQKASRCASV